MEFEFRYWSEIEQQIVYSKSFSRIEDFWISYSKDPSAKLTQYLGLTDADGIKIFGHDIVRHTIRGKAHPYISEIRFSIPHHRWYIGRPYHDDSMDDSYPNAPWFFLTPANAKKMEIIGTIFQTPALLKKF